MCRSLVLCLVLTLWMNCECDPYGPISSNGFVSSGNESAYVVTNGEQQAGPDGTNNIDERATGGAAAKRAVNYKNPVLKRTRRYLTFPEGSTFSFAFCMTVKVLTPDDPDIFSEAVALATSYDLPNNTRALGLWPEEKGEATKLSRRQRSYVYNKAESILDKLGFPGRECVLRTICEGAQQLEPADNVLTEVLRVILSFPEDHPGQDEPKWQWIYLAAYKAGLNNRNCPDLYPTCSVSLIDAIMALRPIR